MVIDVIEINKSHFKFHSILGKGGFGRVSNYVAGTHSLLFTFIGMEGRAQEVQDVLCHEGAL